MWTPATGRELCLARGAVSATNRSGDLSGAACAGRVSELSSGAPAPRSVLLFRVGARGQSTDGGTSPAQVREALRHAPGKYEDFLQVIYEFESSPQRQTAVDLYRSLQILLQDWPQLLKDFARPPTAPGQMTLAWPTEPSSFQEVIFPAPRLPISLCVPCGVVPLLAVTGLR